MRAKAGSDFSESGRNLWNTVWDVLGEFHTDLVVLSYFEDFEAARIGLTSHFALDIVSLSVEYQFPVNLDVHLLTPCSQVPTRLFRSRQLFLYISWLGGSKQTPRPFVLFWTC